MSSTPNVAGTPVILDSIVVATPSSPSPVKAKKVRAQAASEALLKSIGGPSVEPARVEEEEGDSITVERIPKRKATKPKALPSQDKLEGVPTATMAPAIPAAVMVAEEPHVEDAPGAALELKEKSIQKKGWINTAGSDSDDSDDTDPGNGERSAGILNVVNANANRSVSFTGEDGENPAVIPATKGLTAGKSTVRIDIANCCTIR